MCGMLRHWASAVCVVVVASCLAGTVHAGEWITELGVGYKVQQSEVMEPNLTVCEFWSDERFQSGSCGGDNPVFIGWPIAYEWTWRPSVVVRAGWFHFSSWFDGSNTPVEVLDFGDDNELTFDALAVSVRFNWAKMRRGK